MDYEALVRSVTNEVLRRLEEKSPSPPAGRLLVIFTGGVIGLDEALAGLKRLQDEGVRFTVVLSQAAETVIGAARIQAVLGEDLQTVYSRFPYPGHQLREASGVLVPVLTHNTAAKLAATFSDTMVTTLILQALLLGKPVVAAQDASEPLNVRAQGWPAAKAPPGLINALTANHKKLETLGIRLVPALRLAEEGRKLLMMGTARETASGQASARRSVLSAEAVKAAARGERKILLVPGTIVTPLARETAVEYGVDLVETE